MLYINDVSVIRSTPDIRKLVGISQILPQAFKLKYNLKNWQ
jgi:hypothetical protein